MYLEQLFLPTDPSWQYISVFINLGLTGFLCIVLAVSARCLAPQASAVWWQRPQPPPPTHTHPPPQGPPYLQAVALSVVLFTQVALKFIRFNVPRGTRRYALEPESGASEVQAEQALEAPPKVTLSWTGLCYRVQNLRLLHEVSGEAKPGQLTALMGVTGAGKTTLLDVLAHRKRTGAVSGSVLVNGQVLRSEQYRYVPTRSAVGASCVGC